MFDTLMASLSHGMVGVIVTGFAMIFMGLALIRMDSGWMLAAAFLTIPYAYTAGSWSGLLLMVRLLPLTQFLSAYFIDKEEGTAAWAFAIPSLALLIYFFYDILVKQPAIQLLLG